MPEQHEPLIPAGPKLTFKERKEGVRPPVEPLEERKRTRDRKGRKKHQKVNVTRPGSGALQSGAAFVLVTLLLGALLYHQYEEMTILSEPQANLVRLCFVVGLYVVLLLEAFTQDMMQGLFCVFFAPYAYVYGIFFADAGPLRGFTVAVILFLGAEMYFQPKDALVYHAIENVESVIARGRGLIMDEPRREAGFER
ncbi:MAG: hypothetical protein JJU29_03310 [Verrucomicrobia bacterium]|nr:hypothetical protein [Verrucomicrobiota bacterium]MCH8510734.1 hypothetical protein [Kiritimatiellia bacterium]